MPCRNLITLLCYSFSMRVVPLLLALAMQVAPPVPGQETVTPSQGSDNAKTKANGYKGKPTGPVAVKPADPPTDLQDKVKPVAPDNKDQNVKLTSIPPIAIVDKEKTWKDSLFDWGPWVFNCFLVIVGGLQVWIIRRQADLMRDQRDDARASGAQSSNTASETLKAIQKQAGLMDGQLTQMQEAAKQATRHLGLTERPWISPIVNPVGSLTVTEHGIHLKIRVEVNNVGKSPAVGIWISPSFYFPKGRPDLADHVKRICEQTKSPTSWGRIVFPSKTQPYIENWVISGTPEEVERAVAVDDMYTAMVIVAVGYRSTVDEEARHYTTVLYDLAWIDPTLPIPLRSMLRRGVDYPMEQLSLVVSPLFGPVAE